MIADALAALSQIFTPPFRRVLYKILALTLAILTLVWIALDRFIIAYIAVPYPWLATMLSLLPAASAMVGGLLIVLGAGRVRDVGVLLVVAYGVLLGLSALLSAVRFRSLRVGLLTIPALVATQGAYVGGFVHGLARGR